MSEKFATKFQKLEAKAVSLLETGESWELKAHLLSIQIFRANKLEAKEQKRLKYLSRKLNKKISWLAGPGPQLQTIERLKKIYGLL